MGVCVLFNITICHLVLPSYLITYAFSTSWNYLSDIWYKFCSLNRLSWRSNQGGNRGSFNFLALVNLLACGRFWNFSTVNVVKLRNVCVFIWYQRLFSSETCLYISYAFCGVKYSLLYSYICRLLLILASLVEKTGFFPLYHLELYWMEVLFKVTNSNLIDFDAFINWIHRVA